jgi:hypothetical protein
VLFGETPKRARETRAVPGGSLNRSWVERGTVVLCRFPVTEPLELGSGAGKRPGARPVPGSQQPQPFESGHAITSSPRGRQCDSLGDYDFPSRPPPCVVPFRLAPFSASPHRGFYWQCVGWTDTRPAPSAPLPFFGHPPIVNSDIASGLHGKRLVKCQGKSSQHHEIQSHPSPPSLDDELRLSPRNKRGGRELRHCHSHRSPARYLAN